MPEDICLRKYLEKVTRGCVSLEKMTTFKDDLNDAGKNIYDFSLSFKAAFDAEKQKRTPFKRLSEETFSFFPRGNMSTEELVQYIDGYFLGLGYTRIDNKKHPEFPDYLKEKDESNLTITPWGSKFMITEERSRYLNETPSPRT